MSDFVKFPSIEKFSDVNAMVRRAFPLEERPTLTYRGKVKLHGTNASIIVTENGSIIGGKRTGTVDIQNDNAGFANWLETAKKTWDFLHETAHIIYGEWAGPGVQKGVAISQIEKKSFFPFSVYFPEYNTWVYEPKNIELYVDGLPDTYVLPWATEEFKVDMKFQGSMERFTQDISTLVEDCDRSDPFVKDQFGIDGIGEGFVFYPVDIWLMEESHKKYRSQYLFKAKGESHSNSKVSKFKAMVTVDPIVASSVDAFVTQFVTEARIDQGINETSAGEPVMKNLGPFMAWIGADVKKESVNELEASGLEWKQVAKAVNVAAREKYLKKVEQTINV